MNCREVVELLLEYLDGELPPEQAEHIRRHLHVCRPCECYVQTYQLTITLSRQLPAAPPPEAVLDRLREAVREEREA